MNASTFTNKLKETPEQITFEETMQVIEAEYTFTPTAFQNGDLYNEAGQNSGSCKLFAFAQDQGYTVDETLQCFGDYYRIDVLNDPNGTGHQNIRNFMQYGWEGIRFESQAIAKG
ncbi:type III effector [Reichenbachiella sp. 5M10]|uniref:HopJ type III effector protein n=1 Tax=Reichenbachiella sp. 5M10 TaxID=1889772 RepID=UPI000C1621B8|nr:HopJ type III effector protein [Reichenbachiella sp. 5M10]PIB35288.1 type III effector [Reichenbachiella sp. 5M10]